MKMYKKPAIKTSNVEIETTMQNTSIDFGGATQSLAPTQGDKVYADTKTINNLFGDIIDRNYNDNEF